MSKPRLNEADKAILSYLEEGRVTAAYLARKTGWSRNYITQRLRRLEEHRIVENLEGVGLYKLIDNELAKEID